MPQNKPDTDASRRRVLFVSSNGAGVGHLMRLMAMARRATDEIEPLFLTMSQAVSVVANAGFFVEYLMSSGYSGMATPAWHSLLRARLGQIIGGHDVRAIVFDGTWPYRGLLDAFEDHPHVRTVWSRRAMWKADLDSPSPAASHRFDLILEPGEYAEAIDRGQTAFRRAEATRVAPVTFLGREEMLDRAAAREQLGLDPERPAALVQLGAGNINDTSSLLGAVVDRLAAQDDLQVCVTKSIISHDTGGAADAAISLEGIYPLAKYLHAFDMAVAASGYNTFHELLAAAVPTLFVPNLETQADDQSARAKYAAMTEVALAADPAVSQVLTALDELLRPDRREMLAANAARRMPGNGAADAMAAIEQLLDVGLGAAPDRATGDLEPPPAGLPPGAPPPAPRSRPESPQDGPVGSTQARDESGSTRRAANRVARTDTATARALRGLYKALPESLRRVIRRRLGPSAFAAGAQPAVTPLHLPVPTGRQQRRRLEGRTQGVAILLSDELGADERSSMLQRLVALRAEHPAVALLLVTFDADLSSVREVGLPVELLPTREAWNLIGPGRSWTDHVRERVEHLGATWRLDRLVALGTIGDLDQLDLLELTLPTHRRARVPSAGS